MGGGPTRERGRPARMLSRCVPLSFPGVQRPNSPLPSTRVEEMGQAVPGRVRAGRPHSRVGYIP